MRLAIESARLTSNVETGCLQATRLTSKSSRSVFDFCASRHTNEVIGFNAKIVEIANTETCKRSCWAVNAVVARQIAKEMAPQLLQDSKLNAKLMQMANIELLLARPLPNAPARA
jgi:hypothetical protein